MERFTKQTWGRTATDAKPRLPCTTPTPAGSPFADLLLLARRILGEHRGDDAIDFGVHLRRILLDRHVCTNPEQATSSRRRIKGDDERADGQLRKQSLRVGLSLQVDI